MCVVCTICVGLLKKVKFYKKITSRVVNTAMILLPIVSATFLEY